MRVAVDLVDHRGERRRLARAGRARDEDEAARLIASSASDARQAELLERLQLLRDDPEGGAERLALEVDVDAEAGEARNRVRRVDLALDLELLLLLRREDAVEQLLGVLGRRARSAVKALELTADADRRRRPHREVEVGGAPRDHRLEEVVDRSNRSGDGGSDPGHEFGYRQGRWVT